MTDDLKPRTLRDDVASDIRKALDGFTSQSGNPLRRDIKDDLAKMLTPVVLEIVEHREQLARIDRGILPYDED